MDEEDHDMCKGKGEGCQGGSLDEEVHDDMCGGEGGGGRGGPVDEVAHELLKEKEREEEEEECPLMMHLLT